MQTASQTLLLVRGLPGSGKTTFALDYAERGWRHLEADQFLVDEQGQYLFHPKKLSLVHRLCFEEAAEALFAGQNVVVSNTFTELWELANYRHLADFLGVELVVHQCTGTYRSIHNIPELTMRAMLRRFQPLPEPGSIDDRWGDRWRYRIL